ncbi:hypothetical protein ABIE44_002369 [Marmoricola sp. OAE513]|uniref:hypothetical protein n=1 Tax=Marmoricola sp. OAE513 TaxID=2817894 RepID=UPI001AE288BC
MTDIRDLRNARIGPTDESEVISALVAGGPATAGALRELPQFRTWSERRLQLALGAAWVDDKVSIDENDAFVPLRTW